MQTKDHLVLGHDLLEKSGNKELYRHRWAFLLGCVEPDYNILTYLRGALKSRGINGHNAENTEKVIASRLMYFQASGLRGSFDYFRLGCMLHYAADAFTLPHNAFSGMNLIEHVAYEDQLHSIFKEFVNHSTDSGNSPGIGNLFRNYREMRETYCRTLHTYESDCGFIISACRTLLAGCLKHCQSAGTVPCMKGEVLYEGSYHHGLV